MNVAARLRQHIEVLARDIGERHVGRPKALQAAADYIEQQWRTQGYSVDAQRYDAQGIECANLEVSIDGAERPEEIIVVGAHYDTVPGSPGADDNGSGVAALLEISRALRESAPTQTIRLVAFVNEEAPFFYWQQMGSMVYAKAARSRNWNIRLMISLEMLGCYHDEPGSQRYPPLFQYFFPDRGNFIAFVSNLRSRRVLRRTAATFKECCDFPAERVATFGFIPGIGWSDHSSFWRHGYPALMVTDTAFHRNAHYHRASDLPETIDYERMATVTVGLGDTLVSLARGGL